MIPLHKVCLRGDLDDLGNSLAKVLASGWIGEGPAVKDFENALSSFVGSTQITALNSCTSAIALALRLSHVEPGDEVITTAMTCSATNMPVLLAGAKPVWADVCPHTGNVNPDSIRKKVTEKTRAILVVHWAGYPCDMDVISAIAAEHGIPVIEDAAHALGSHYRNRPIGSHSDFVCFSFQAIKSITTGDGGALVCKDIAAHERARSLKWFGIDREKRKTNEYNVAEWDIKEAGYKFQMNDIAATIGLTQLPHLDAILEQRRLNAQHFNTAFKGLERVTLPRYANDSSSAYWLYTLLVDEQFAFIQHLKTLDIEASIVHTRNDLHSVFKPYREPNLPGLDEFAKNMVCIPVGPWVTETQRQHIIKAVVSQSW